VLAGATQAHRIIVAEQPPDVAAKASRNTQILEADVGFGQPDPEDFIASSRLRWVHISTAGYSRYDTPAMKAIANPGN